MSAVDKHGDGDTRIPRVGAAHTADTLRGIAPVAPPPPAWAEAIIAHSLGAPAPRRRQLALALEWLWAQWEQWLPQPRLALAATLATATAVVAVSAGLWWGGSEPQWSTADNLDYFALALLSAEPYDLDWDWAW